jgi:hypothetical protein
MGEGMKSVRRGPRSLIRMLGRNQRAPFEFSDEAKQSCLAAFEIFLRIGLSVAALDLYW